MPSCSRAAPVACWCSVSSSGRCSADGGARARGVARPVLARPDDSPAASAAVDGAFRAKYGLVDWWFGLLLRRQPLPVRLDSAPPAD
jgi:hypothetical protein